MSELTPELRDEIAQHLRASSRTRIAITFQNVEEGLDAEQIAERQGITLAAARAYMRNVEEMLSGKLPTTPSSALGWSRNYRDLYGRDLLACAPRLRDSCLHYLHTINPEVRVDEPLGHRTLPDAGTQRRSRPTRGSRNLALPDDEWAAELGKLATNHNWVERRLRELIAQRFLGEEERRGEPGWATSRILAALVDTRRRSIEAATTHAVLEQLYWLELVAVVSRNWAIFERVFPDKKAF